MFSLTQRHIKKIYKFFTHGAGEALSFIYAMPLMIIIFAFLVSTIQVGSVNERLEYIAYDACRKAIVQDNYKDAKRAAQIAANADFVDVRNADIKFVPGTVEYELYILGVDKTDPKEYTKEDLKQWRKGTYVQFIIRVKTDPPLIFFKKTRTAQIVMMIENPAGESGEYPWFDYFRTRGRGNTI